MGEGGDGQVVGVNQFVIDPKADLDFVFGYIRDEVEFDFIMRSDARDLEGMASEGDSAIAIGDALLADAEDIADGGKGSREGEGAEEGAIFIEGFFEAQGRDLVGGGVDLEVVVAVEFFAQDRVGVGTRGDVLEGTGADDAILEPAIRSFDLSFCLGRKRVGDIRVHQGQDLALLGVDVIGTQDHLSPNAIAALDEAKNA